MGEHKAGLNYSIGPMPCGGWIKRLIKRFLCMHCMRWTGSLELLIAFRALSLFLSSFHTRLARCEKTRSNTIEQTYTHCPHPCPQYTGLYYLLHSHNGSGMVQWKKYLRSAPKCAFSLFISLAVRLESFGVLVLSLVFELFLSDGLGKQHSTDKLLHIGGNSMDCPNALSGGVGPWCRFRVHAISRVWISLMWAH